METIKNFELCIKEVSIDVPSYYKKSLNSIEKCAEFSRSLIGNKVQEHFIIFLIDDALNLLGYQTIAIGKQESVSIDMKILFRGAIEVGATYFIVSHNHPNAVMKPSEIDIKTSHIIQLAGDLVGITMLDHFIVSSVGSISMYSMGLLKGRTERSNSLHRLLEGKV